MLEMPLTNTRIAPNPLQLTWRETAVAVRRARRADAGAIAAICRKAFGATHRRAFLPEELAGYTAAAFRLDRIAVDMAQPKTLFLVAEKAGTVVGSLRLERAAPTPPLQLRSPVELSRLYLEPELKGQGIGSSLMRYALETAAATGAKSCWLGVWEGNQRAINFYRRWGFQPIGTDLFSIGKSRAVGLLMCRPL